MPIGVSCTCGKSFHVKDELAGKKIKCPVCQAVVEVPAASAVTGSPPPSQPPAPVTPGPPQPAKAILVEDQPPATPVAAKVTVIGDDDFIDEAPRAGKKKKKRSQEGSKTMLFVGIGAGVVLLGLCCIGGGIGGYFLFLSGPGDPEKAIIGKWEYESGIGAQVVMIGSAKTYEFRADGTCKTNTTGGLGQPSSAKWKVLKKDGNTLTVEIAYQDFNIWTETFDLTFVSKNSMELRINRTDKLGMRMKRVS
jgi:hypothetical protein